MFTNDMSGDPCACVKLCQMVSEFVSGSYTGKEKVALTLSQTPPRQMILPLDAPTYDSDQVVMVEKDKTSLDLQLLRAAQVLYVIRPLVEWAYDARDLMLTGVLIDMTHMLAVVIRTAHHLRKQGGVMLFALQTWLLELAVAPNISCHLISCHTIPYHIISHHITSYHIMACHNA